MWREVTENNFSELRPGILIGKLVEYKFKRQRIKNDQVIETMFRNIYLVEAIDTTDKVTMREKKFGFQTLKKRKSMLVNANYFFRSY